MNRILAASLTLAASLAALPVSAQQPSPAPAPVATSAAAPAAAPRTAAGRPAPPPVPVLPRVPSVAPGYGAPPISTPNAEIAGVTQQPFVGLALGNAVGMALANNPQLASAQLNRTIAAYQIESARGAYDVRLSIEPQYTYSKSAPQNAFFAGPNFGPLVNKQFGVNAGVEGRTQGGQQYSVSASGQRVNNNGTINTFDPTYPTMFSASLSQPLGRGRSIDEVRRALALAGFNAQNVDAQTLASASQTIAQVEDTYWDLVAAWRNVAIQEQALRDALRQQQSTARLARRGVNAPIEVVQSNTQVDVFQDNVFSAVENVSRLQNALKESMLANPADPIWNANLVPTSPVLQLPAEPRLTDLVMQALRDRPEMAQVTAQRQSAAVNVRYASDQLKPQLDLRLGYQSNGFAGAETNPLNSPFTASSIQQVAAINALIAAANKTLPPAQQIPPLVSSNTPTPGYLVGGLGQSIKNLVTNQFPTYSVGVQYQMRLGNRTAKADLQIAQAQDRQVQVQEAATVSRITVEVRNALQTYQSAQYRLIAARSARQASEQVLASEERRFHSGASTTFLVLQRQLDVANTRGRELQAQTDLNKAVVELQRATGTILPANGVTLSALGQGATK